MYNNFAVIFGKFNENGNADQPAALFRGHELKHVLQYVSKDKSRPGMQAVRFHFMPDRDILEVIATDGHRLGKFRIDGVRYKNFEQTEDGPEIQLKIAIPDSVIKAGIKGLKKTEASVTRAIQIQEGGKFSLVTRDPETKELVETDVCESGGTFPNVDRVLEGLRENNDQYIELAGEKMLRRFIGASKACAELLKGMESYSQTMVLGFSDASEYYEEDGDEGAAVQFQVKDPMYTKLNGRHTVYTEYWASKQFQLNGKTEIGFNAPYFVSLGKTIAAMKLNHVTMSWKRPDRAVVLDTANGDVMLLIMPVMLHGWEK